MEQEMCLCCDKPVQDCECYREIPRRACLDHMTPAELAIRNAQIAVDEAGADVLLTEAGDLLSEAREKVADFVDGKPRVYVFNPKNRKEIMKFRKKPVVIEAEQFNSATRPLPFSGRGDPCCFDDERGTRAQSYWYVQTLEGPLAISEGDWIIRGVKGEFYPCKPDIFEATYEPVED